eukprot:sb/3463735/
MADTISDDDSIIDIEELVQDPTTITETEGDILSGLVSARTGGIRGRRYGEPEFVHSETEDQKEDGEISEDEEDIDIMEESDPLPSPAVNKSPVVQPVCEPAVEVKTEILDSGYNSLLESFQRTTNPSPRQKPAPKRSLKHEISTANDIYDIQSRIAGVLAPTTNGVEKLKSGFQQIQIKTEIVTDDEDEEEKGGGGLLDFSSSSEGEDSETEVTEKCAVQSTTSELNRDLTRSLKIKEPFAERYPTVEIEELTLGPHETLQSLGQIKEIVDDFVVIKGSNRDQVLDIESMVFNSERRCVGYVFEVLGPVHEPYYSLHFNTHSDIGSYGLAKGQEVYYAENTRYHRMLMTNMLSQIPAASDGEESDESDEELVAPPRPVKTARRRLQNRTTHNYSVKFSRPDQRRRNQQQPPPEALIFPSVPQTIGVAKPTLQQERHQHVRNQPMLSQDVVIFPPTPTVPTQPSQQPATSFLRQKPLMQPNQQPTGNTDLIISEHQPPKPKQPQFHRDMPKETNNFFKNSVLSSFMDPFSLDKPS